MRARRVAGVLTTAAALLAAGCRCGGGPPGADAGEDDGRVRPDVSFPQREACTAADMPSIVLSDSVAPLPLSAVRCGALDGTDAVAYLVYQQSGEYLHQPVVVREVRAGGEIGEPQPIDLGEAFAGESAYDVVAGTYREGRMHLVVGQINRPDETGFTGDDPISYYLAIDLTSRSVVYGPKPIMERCLHEPLGPGPCTGEYRLHGENLYAAITWSWCTDPTETRCDWSAMVGQVDPEWTEHENEAVMYFWSATLPGSCVLDADLAFIGDRTMVGWIGEGSCDETPGGLVQGWFGDTPEMEAELEVEAYRRLPGGFWGGRDIAVAAGRDRFAVLSERQLAIFAMTGEAISEALTIGSDPDGDLRVVLGYGGGYFAAVFPGSAESAADGGLHLQVSLVDEDGAAEARQIIYCTEENPDPAYLPVSNFWPVGVHWLGTGFVVAYFVEELPAPGAGGAGTPRTNLRLAWVPPP
jgi:hypothetical protein